MSWITENLILSTKDAQMTGFVYSSGGGMTGGFSRMSITASDDKNAKIVSEGKDWHNSKPVQNERLVQRTVLDEIETVFRQNNMEEWQGKVFTDFFVCDGPSYNYYFTFDNGAQIQFSSQVFPEPYSGILREIDEIIKKY